MQQSAKSMRLTCTVVAAQQMMLTSTHCCSSPLHPQESTGPQLLQALQLGVGLLAASLLTATQQLARTAGNWWHSSCSSDAQWYGRYVHPVFYLAGSPELQQQLQQQGVAGVPEAAAAASRLLDAAATLEHGLRDSSSSSSRSGYAASPGYSTEQMQQDLEAIRLMICSKEAADLQQQQQRQRHHGASSCVPPSAAADSFGAQSLPHQQPAQPLTAEQQHATSWGLLQPDAAHFFEASPFSPERAAYQQAVMHERDLLLTQAMWAAAEAAAVTQQAPASGGSSRWLGRWGREATSEQPRPCVVAVVGANHLPGIAAAWAERVAAFPAANGLGPKQVVEGREQSGVRRAAVDDPAHAGDASSKQLERSVQHQLQQQEPPSVYATSAGHPAWVTPTVAAGVEVGCVGAAGYALLKRWQRYHARQHSAAPAEGAGAAAAASSAWSQARPTSSWEQSASRYGSGMASHDSARFLKRLLLLLLGQSALPAAFSASVPAPAAAAAAAALHTATTPTMGAGGRASRLPLRLGLVLLPVAAAAWPLWQERRRREEAAGLLQCVAAVNDDMLRYGSMTESTRDLLQLAHVVSSWGPCGAA